jgi:molybdenum cofactor cytidylyltransferase
VPVTLLIAAVVLAAGLARRMGRQKLLLEVQGSPIVRRAVEGVLPHVDDVVVVTGPADAAMPGALAGLRVRFAVNPHPEHGQGTSIAIGVAALGIETTAALVVLGDQPALPSSVVPSLIEAFRGTGNDIVAPIYRGLQGTPVLFGRAVFPELIALSGDAGARSVVEREARRVERVAFDFAMPLDIDTPEDYARLSGTPTSRS